MTERPSTKPQADPRVSVVIPVHDAEDTLEEALACVGRQTLVEHETIVVLNGITDASGEIAERAAARDGRIRLLHRATANLAKALNAGVDAARAPLIARHDGDDVMGDGRLYHQEGYLADNAGVVGVKCAVFCSSVGGGDPGDGMIRHIAWLNQLRTPDAIRAGRFIDAPMAHPSVMMRTEVIRQAGGYRDGDFPEDQELWLRLFEMGASFGHLDEVLVDWRDRPDRFTRTDPRCRDEARRVLVHRYLMSGPLRDGRRCRIWGAGPYGRRHARDLHRDHGCVDDLLDIDPRKVGRLVAGGLPVNHASEVGGPDGRLILLAVASPGAREEIIAFLEGRGHRLERDYLALQ